MTLWPVQDAELAVIDYQWSWAEREQARIDAHWQAKNGANRDLFDGRILLASHYAMDGDILRGACFETDFSKFLAWRDFGFPDPSVVNIFAMAALRADDGAYLLAVMGAHTANAGRIYFPAGTPDLHDVRDQCVDLAGSVVRELSEETGLRADEVEPQSGFTALRAGQRLALMRDVFVSGEAEAVREMIRARLHKQDERELADMYIARDESDIDPARMPDFIVAFLQARFA